MKKTTNCIFVIICTLILSQSYLSSQCKFISISRGENHTLGIGIDGSLWAWGDNSYGQLGDGTFQNNPHPIQIGKDLNWKIVVASNILSFAIKDDGSLWAWGSNNEGRLGLGSNIAAYGVPTRVGTDKWNFISSGQYNIHGIKSDGSLWYWGWGAGLFNEFNNILAPKRFGTESNWKFVSCSDVGQSRIWASYGIKKDGSLWSWGHNVYGLLGIGYEKDTLISSPNRVGNDSNWTFITNAEEHVAALKSDGSLWTWGNNPFGQLGNAPYYFVNTVPTQVGLGNNYLKVDIGYNYSLAVQKDGSLWAWGKLKWIKYDSDSLQSSIIPLKVGNDNDWKEISSTSAITYAIKNDLTLFRWGNTVKYPRNICCQSVSTSLDFVLCSNDSLFINGKFITKNTIDTIKNFEGCDSLVKINISFYPFVIGAYIDTICYGENRFILGKLYDKNNPTGQTRIVSGNKYGCDSIVDVSLTFLDSISIGETIIQDSQRIELNLNVNGGLAPYKYNWSTGDSTQSVQLNRDGLYTVTITDSKYCSAVKIYYFKSTGTEQNSIKNLKIFQNDQIITLSHDQFNIDQIQCYDLSGKNVLALEPYKSQVRLVRSQMPKGFVIVKVKLSNNSIIVAKILN
ncbi:MAG: hypothetical protein LKG19_15155 [Saprospiraceae bacterium]|jgi:alpha-tubulin suppressor-like RCC1 family protein|nr:hypothetical protein [Saprospiraceae bacterium]